MAVKKVKFPNWGLQTKIIILFIIIFSVVATTAYFVRENERILRQTLFNLSQPDEKLTFLHNILSILPQAENRLRFYTLTNNSSFYDEYELLIDSVKINVWKLRENYINDPLTNRKLDSISTLIEQRKLLIQSYLEIKNEYSAYDLPNRAFRTLKKGAPDSVYKQKKTSTTIITTYDTIKTQQPKSEVNPKRNGLFRRIKKAFSKNEASVEIKPESDSIIKSTTKIETDTAAISPSDTSGFYKIEHELSKIWLKDLENYNELRSRELNMLQNSSLLIDQITDIFRRIEVAIITENQLGTLAARDRASKSLLLIGLINIVALALIILLVILILNSIRKSNRYRKELFFANMQAVELAKVKEEFLANMSHEMRTPLNAIIGFSDLLSNTNLDLNQNKYLQAVRKSSRHLLDTVNDILDLTRLAAGKFQISEIDFNLGEILDDVITPFSVEAEVKGLSFIVECKNTHNILLKGDPLRLRQILYNLLSNAMKFTLKGSITVNCQLEIKDQDIETTITVADTGIGIPYDNLESIFEDFQQIESTSARSYGGSGLGLAISRRLARLQNGDITVASKLGNGSTFKLKIKYQISKNQPEELVSKQSISKDVTITKKNLLVVDDDNFNTLLVKIIGENHGINIQIATDGFSAMEMIEKYKFDLIMTDLQMPGFTGKELVHFIRNHIKKEISELPVIAFTANKIERFDERLLLEGFNEVLQKPYTEEEFIDKILFYLAKRQYSNEASVNVLRDAEQTDANLIKPYNLDQVLLFSSGNKDQIRNIIQTFITTSTQSGKQMMKAFEKSDFLEIKELAHRLLTSYGHFNILICLPILNELDKITLSAVDKERVKDLIVEFENNNRIIFKLLNQEIIALSEN